MKHILKKNQVIITALAIMIAVAGYLNFTEENADMALSNVTEELSVSPFSTSPSRSTSS